jgi:hypothetical protein
MLLESSPPLALPTQMFVRWHLYDGCKVYVPLIEALCSFISHWRNWKNRFMTCK